MGEICAPFANFFQHEKLTLGNKKKLKSLSLYITSTKILKYSEAKFGFCRFGMLDVPLLIGRSKEIESRNNPAIIIVSIATKQLLFNRAAYSKFKPGSTQKK